MKVRPGSSSVKVGGADHVTFTLQQEVSPEAEDERLSVQLLLVLGEGEGEASADLLGRQLRPRTAEDAEEGGGKELHLHQEGTAAVRKKTLPRSPTFGSAWANHLLEEPQCPQPLPEPAGADDTSVRRGGLLTGPSPAPLPHGRLTSAGAAASW